MGQTPIEDDLAILQTVSPFVQLGLQGQVVETPFAVLDEDGDPLVPPEPGIAGYTDYVSVPHGWVWMRKSLLTTWWGFNDPDLARGSDLPAPPPIPRLVDFLGMILGDGTFLSKESNPTLELTVEPSTAFSAKQQPVVRARYGSPRTTQNISPVSSISVLFLGDATYG